MKHFTFFLSVMLLCSLNNFATLIIVPDDYTTIQAAINAAQPGDTVLVKAETYYEQIDFTGKDIVVGSLFLTTGDSSYIQQTVINASAQGSVVTFNNGESPAALLSGFTITNGSGTVESGGLLMGGGIYIKNSSPTLDHLYVINNVAGGMGGNGGGIYFNNSSSLVKDCLIANNEANRGGGIRFTEADVTLQGTWIRDNFAVAAGGGLMCYASLQPQIDRCTFTGNQSAYGGALSIYESHLLINRTTVFDNHGINGSGINAESFSLVMVINSIFWNNTMNPGTISEIQLTGPTNTLFVAYSDIMGGQAGIINPNESVVMWMEGNLAENPQFTDLSVPDLSLEEDSPCINAGVAVYIYNGDTLVNITDYSGDAPDMGAYEFYEPVTSDQAPLAGNQLNLQVRAGNTADERMICFSLPERQQVHLALFDMRGREIICLANHSFPSGEYRIPLHVTGLQAGVYIIRMTNGKTSESRKLLIN